MSSAAKKRIQPSAQAGHYRPHPCSVELQKLEANHQFLQSAQNLFRNPKSSSSTAKSGVALADLLSSYSTQFRSSKEEKSVALANSFAKSATFLRHVANIDAKMNILLQHKISTLLEKVQDALETPDVVSVRKKLEKDEEIAHELSQSLSNTREEVNDYSIQLVHELLSAYHDFFTSGQKIVSEVMGALDVTPTAPNVTTSRMQQEYIPLQQVKQQTPLSNQSLDELTAASDYKKLEKFVYQQQTLVYQLGTIITAYEEPLKSDAKLMSKLDLVDVKEVFDSIDVLYSVHTNILKDLEICLRKWPEVPPSKVFKDHIKSLDVHIGFAERCSSTVAALHRCKKSSRRVRSLFDVTVECGGRLDLQGLLTAPLQVPYRYYRFLDAIIQNREAKDFEVFVEAMKEVTSIIKVIELSSAAEVSSNKIQHLKAKVTGLVENLDLEAEGLHLLYEGELSLVDPPNTVEDYHAFLFSNVLVLCKRNRGKYKLAMEPKYRYYDKIYLEDTTLEDQPDGKSFLLKQSSLSYHCVTSCELDKKTWMMQLTLCMQELKKDKVFCVSLEELMEREPYRLIPLFVEKCINYLTQHSLSTEGLFRVCGRATEIERLKQMFNTDIYADISDQENVHDVAGTLRLWLRCLPSPVVPAFKGEEFLNSSKIDDESERVEKLKSLVEDLPYYNKFLLQHIIKFLYNVSLHSDKNKMDRCNISIIFGPSILKTTRGLASFEEHKLISLAVESLLEHYTYVFKEIEQEYKKFTEENQQQWFEHELREKQRMAKEREDQERLVTRRSTSSTQFSAEAVTRRKRPVRKKKTGEGVSQENISRHRRSASGDQRRISNSKSAGEDPLQSPQRRSEAKKHSIGKARKSTRGSHEGSLHGKFRRQSLDHEFDAPFPGVKLRQDSAATGSPFPGIKHHDIEEKQQTDSPFPGIRLHLDGRKEGSTSSVHSPTLLKSASSESSSPTINQANTSDSAAWIPAKQSPRVSEPNVLE